jgi:hypothetical protein
MPLVLKSKNPFKSELEGVPSEKHSYLILYTDYFTVTRTDWMVVPLLIESK